MSGDYSASPLACEPCAGLPPKDLSAYDALLQAAPSAAMAAAASYESALQPGGVLGPVSAGCGSGTGEPHPDAMPELQARLSRLKDQVTTTPHEHAARLQRLAELREQFSLMASRTAGAIARAFHEASSFGTEAEGSRRMEEALCKLRADGSLRLVSRGTAGGVKVSDTRAGAFFKIASDVAGIYKGSAVMADKAAKHELAALAFLHNVVDSPHLTVPVAACTDVTVRGPDGRPERVYRVQATSLLPLGRSTLRLGSEDANATANLSADCAEVARSLAAAFRLGPSFAQPRQVTVHTYARVALPRDPARLPVMGPESEALLERLGAGRAQSEATGVCAAVQAASGAIVDPLQPTAVTHSSETLPLRGLAAERLPVAFRAGGGGYAFQQVLPFDVEVHLLPTGERCVADTHRLCIPEAYWTGSAARGAAGGRVAVVWSRVGAGGETPAAAAPGPADDEDTVCVVELPAPAGTGNGAAGGDAGGRASSAAAAAAAVAAARACDPRIPPWAPALPDDCEAGASDTGVSIVPSASGQTVVLLPECGAYWRASHLSCLFRPNAGAVLQALDPACPPLSPDALLARAPPEQRAALERATRALLGPANLREAATAVAEEVSKAASAGRGDSPASLRAAVKRGLHSRGLGLRHCCLVWLEQRRMWGGSAAGIARAEVAAPAGPAAKVAAASAPAASAGASAAPCHPGLADLAMVCACLPRAGSSAAASLERLARWQGRAALPSSGPWLVACAAARAVACKGMRLRASEQAAVARAVCDDSGSAHWIVAMWMAEQADAAVSPKMDSRGASHEGRGAAAGHGAEFKTSTAAAMATLLRELAHRQRTACGPPGSLAWHGPVSVMNRAAELGSTAPSLRQEVEALSLAAAAQLRAHCDDDGGRAAPLLARPLMFLAQEARVWGHPLLAAELLGHLQAALEAPAVAGQPNAAALRCQAMLVAGVCASEAGRGDRAVELNSQALAAAEAAFPETHDVVQMALNALATSLRAQGNPQAAMRLLTRCLRLRAATDGSDSVGFAAALGNSASCMADMGKFSAAAESLARGLTIMAAALGHAHPSTLDMRSNLANALLSAGRSEEALREIRGCVAEAEAARGGDDPSLVAPLSALGACLTSRGRFDEAEPALRRAVQLAKRQDHGNLEALVAALGSLGDCLQSKGDLEEAVAAFRASADACAGLGQRGTALRAAAMSNAAICLKQQGSPAEAMRIHEEALAMQVQALGRSHLSCSVTRSEIAACMMSLGDDHGAIELLRECKAAALAEVGQAHPLYASASGNLALCLLSVGNSALAAEEAQDAAAAFAMTMGPDHPQTRHARDLVRQIRSGSA